MKRIKRNLVKYIKNMNIYYRHNFVYFSFSSDHCFKTWKSISYSATNNFFNFSLTFDSTTSIYEHKYMLFLLTSILLHITIVVENSFRLFVQFTKYCGYF